MRRSTTLCAAAALAAAGFFAASPADAAFRVIQWNITKVCQIYAFGVDGPPIPANYRVLTGPLPTFGAALRAKNALWRRGRCLI
jgi:hypothetical protein